MGNNLNDKYLDAIKFCEEKGVSSRFAQIYPFTTENIMGYIDKFDLNGKSLLTAGSSCDQAINVAMKGCSDVTIIDVCPFTKYYFYLKKAALLTLPYEEFQNYLCYKNFPKTFQDNQNVFNREIFFKLREILKELDYASYYFWNDLYRCNKPLSIRERIFSYDEEKIRILKSMNLYLQNESKYNECKKTIETFEPKIIKGDILKINFDRTFDNIWLSNIPQYLNNEQFKNLVDKMINYLNEEGKLLISYLYQTQIDTKYYPDYAPIYNLKENYEALKDYLIYIESFKGINGIMEDEETKKDSILIYKK